MIKKSNSSGFLSRQDGLSGDELDILENLDLREEATNFKTHENRQYKNLQSEYERKMEIRKIQQQKALKGKIAKKEKDIKYSQTELKRKEMQFKRQQVEFRKKMVELNRREEALGTKERELNRKEAELNKKETELKERAVSHRESQLEQPTREMIGPLVLKHVGKGSGVWNWNNKRYFQYTQDGKFCRKDGNFEMSKNGACFDIVSISKDSNKTVIITVRDFKDGQPTTREFQVMFESDQSTAGAQQDALKKLVAEVVKVNRCQMEMP